MLYAILEGMVKRLKNLQVGVFGLLVYRAIIAEDLPGMIHISYHDVLVKR
jgi:hypothetical protein